MKITLATFVTLFYLPFNSPIGIINNLISLTMLLILFCIIGLFSILIYLANNKSNKKFA